MSKDSPKKYTTSDYTVLNSHFDHALARENEITRARRATTFWQNAKSWSLLLFFIGITAMFIGKAFYLGKEEKVIEKIVEVPVQTIDRNNINQNESVTIEGEEVSIRTDVIHFKFATVSYKGDEYSVATRHNYADPRDNRPLEQSCYVERFGFNFDVSKKIAEGNITNISISTQPSAEALGLNDSDANFFRRYCQYI